ncbi:WD repeat domain-containing protein 83 isoform X2 [Balearica regulorum gibbericeps]|uniref:WD repeat domain-containing protein 83 isoform X2 n=1 Tax=Balearica regulorum gibbericeps TaxID=100784 RepID=UPI003F5DA4A7
MLPRRPLPPPPPEEAPAPAPVPARHGFPAAAARPSRAAAAAGADVGVWAGRRTGRPLQRGWELLPDLRQRQVPEALEPAQGHSAAHLPGAWLRGAGRRRKVNCVQFNEEATIIVSGSIDSTVRCWDCRSRRPDPVQVLDEAKDGVSSVKVSDHEILSGSVDGRVRRYDLRAGQLYSDYIGSPITSVCFSKDGQCALAASLDSTLRLLDKETGELLGEYTGHRSTAYRLDCMLSEQDTHVGSASEDGNVYFWDLVEGSLALSLAVGRGVVQSLSFHPTLPCLLAATEGRVQLWREETFQPEGDAAAT